MARPLLSKQQQMELLQKALLLKAQLATAIQRSAAHSAAALLMHTSTTALSRTSAAGGGDGEYATAATDVELPSSHVTLTINTSTQSGTMLHGATSSKDHFDIEMGAPSLNKSEDALSTSTVTPVHPAKSGDCSLQSTTEDELDHSASNTTPETDQESLESELHRCPKCDFTTNQINHFKFHILSHIIHFNNAYSATSHTSKDSMNAVFNGFQQEEVSYVEIPSTNKLALTQDFAKSLGSMFSCSICQFSTSDEHTFKIHVLNHTANSEHSSDPTMSLANPSPGDEGGADFVMRGLSKKLYCPICRFCSVSKTNFDRHLASHVRDGRICCDKCLFSTESIEEIKAHVATHYSRNSSRISCPHCDFTTANKSYFKVHLATHTGEGKMYCSYCSYSTVYKSNFRQHVAAHENKTEMQCPLCDFKCVCKSEYGLHFATHTGEKRLACPYCKFNTSNKSYFRQHVGSHTGAGKLACPFCKFSTVNKSYYRIHVSKHTGEGTLKCSLCPFTTVYKNNFRRHIAKHQTVEEESLKIVAAISDQQRRGRRKNFHSLDAEQMREAYSSFDHGRTFDDEHDPHSSPQEDHTSVISPFSEGDSRLTLSFSNSQDVKFFDSKPHFTESGHKAVTNNVRSAQSVFDTPFDLPSTTQDSSIIEGSSNVYGHCNPQIAGSANAFLSPDNLSLRNNEVNLSFDGSSTLPASTLPQRTLPSQVHSNVHLESSLAHKKYEADQLLPL